ncbi:MAG: cupin domain-containing protein [Gammaproteobacteria bacterium]|nr:cupin domain-containing protein [Gammaproteobacteria bacterium]
MKPQTDKSFPTGDEFNALLDPIGMDTFISDYADKQSLLIKGRKDKFAFLKFNVEEFFSSAENFGNQYDRVKVGLNIEGEWERYQEIFPFQARALYRSGMTVCVAGISDINPRLGAYAEGVRLALNIPDLRFNSYLSPDKGGFDLHYDNTPIFLLQIAGKKKWWYGKGTIQPMPEGPSRDYFPKPQLEELEYCELEPGDVLYLPGFTWHHAEAIGFSLGLTLSAKGVHDDLIKAVLKNAPFSEDVPHIEQQPPIAPADVPVTGVPEAARNYLAGQLDALKTYVAGLTVDDMWTAWSREVQVAKGPVIPVNTQRVTEDTLLQRKSAFPVVVDKTAREGDNQVLVVRHACRQAVLGADAEVLVKWLLDHSETLRAGDAAIQAGVGEKIGWLDLQQVLQALVSIGVLQVITVRSS